MILISIAIGTIAILSALSLTAAVLFFVLVPACVITSLRYLLRLIGKTGRRHRIGRPNDPVIGFFHPSRSLESRPHVHALPLPPHGGGGGERVLWSAVAAIQRAYPTAAVCVYTGDVTAAEADAAGRHAPEHALDRFNIDLPRPVHLVPLVARPLLSPHLWPVATLVFQSLAGAFVGLEAIWRLQPDVMIDTSGHAFAYPIWSWASGGATWVASYTHYPVVSSDMLEAQRAQKTLKSRLKIPYYRLFSQLYRLAGSYSGFSMVNSTWTSNHMAAIWRQKPTIVFPPCDTKTLSALPLEGDPGAGRQPNIVYLAQFRPEKDHGLVLRAFAKYLQAWLGAEQKEANPELVDYEAHTGRMSAASRTVRQRAAQAAGLVFIGSIRAAPLQRQQDIVLLRDLISQAQNLLGHFPPRVGVASSPEDTKAALSAPVAGPMVDTLDALLQRQGYWDHLLANGRVRFLVNAPFDLVARYLGQSQVGVHAMRQEHFGIGVVETMAAGCVMVAHDSGGPQADIVVPDAGGNITGFLARTHRDYARAFSHVLGTLDGATRRRIAGHARAHVGAAFSQQRFDRAFVQAVAPAVDITLARMGQASLAQAKI
ncbi:hypothetical protein H696_00107 [Fonticula alba]|uniref:GDP-Man:Man(3)GlcNAc(2)-PP-Dol alpha-1,2-mannosyltransferase n=1 Tax=Fonticula alba TaxID=691883 RepID=A0A058ZF05_FONAL|nr:hypothetical protein H696_00107 [Fonticula alba]KCV72513.1 hypothetical protein H696_00107 [Fonticula alba]|eukprot:XP_009492214.1 hypothetical protein H696_00107 [Fonticula alba]